MLETEKSKKEKSTLIYVGLQWWGQESVTSLTFCWASANLSSHRFEKHIGLRILGTNKKAMLTFDVGSANKLTSPLPVKFFKRESFASYTIMSTKHFRHKKLSAAAEETPTAREAGEGGGGWGFHSDIIAFTHKGQLFATFCRSTRDSAWTHSDYTQHAALWCTTKRTVSVMHGDKFWGLDHQALGKCQRRVWT